MRTLIRFHIKHIFVGMTFVALCLFLLAPLRGIFPPFYYEQYNLVRRNLERVHGLTITDTWKHEDVSLEDCGFDVTVGDTTVSLTFVDHQDWVALFDEVDGIRFVDNGDRVLITREQLHDAGIQVHGLTDILEQLSDVVEFCRSQTAKENAGKADFRSKNKNYSRFIKMRIRNANHL